MGIRDMDDENWDCYDCPYKDEFPNCYICWLNDGEKEE